MAASDHISDMLTRMRNAKDAKHRYVDLIYSKTNASLAQLLKERGYLDEVLVDEAGRRIRAFIRYKKGTRTPVLRNLKRVSKPGLRKYIGYRNLPRIMSGLGIAVISTPQGIMDDQKARELKVGGEWLCNIW